MNACGSNTQFTETNPTRCPDSVDSVPTIVTNCPDYKGAVRNINTSRQQQMQYVVSQDVLVDTLEGEQAEWMPIYIYRHRLRQVGQKNKLEYKVGW